MLPLLSSVFSSAESVLWFVDTFMTLFCWRCLETNQGGVLLKQKHASPLYIARRHGALSIQQKFRFEISEISRAQWSCTFRLHRPDPSHHAFGYCSCKQDTKERYCGQQFCEIERDISVPPTEMTRLVKVDHLQSWSQIFRSDQTVMVRSIWCTNRNFRNFGLNGKRPWTEATSTSIRFYLKTDIFSSDLVHRPHVSGENGHPKRILSKTLFRVKIFENAGFLFTCGRTKTEVFKYDDVIHYILLAWRMLRTGCYRIYIVSAFSCGRAKTLRKDA